MMHARKGSLFLEACMALVVLATAFGVIAQLMAMAAQQQREHEQRRLAILETANVMERVAALSWDELSSDSVKAMELSATTKQRLPDAQLHIDVIPDEQGADSREMSRKEIRVRVDWINLAGMRVEPIQLVAWRHRQENTETP